MLLYFCSFDLDGGPVSSAGSTLPLSLFCRHSVSSVLGLELYYILTVYHLTHRETKLWERDPRIVVERGRQQE